MLTPRRLGEVALLGLGQTTLQYVCYYIGLAHTTAVKTSILSSTLVFFSVLLAHFIYANDKLTPRRLLGCLIGFAGVVAVNFGAGAFDFHFSLMGEGLLLVSTFVGSVAAIYGRRLSQDMDATVMTGWQLLLGGLVLTAMGLAGGGHFASFSIGAGVLVVYLAAVSAVAFALWSLLLKHNPVGVGRGLQLRDPDLWRGPRRAGPRRDRARVEEPRGTDPRQRRNLAGDARAVAVGSGNRRQRFGLKAMRVRSPAG